MAAAKRQPLHAVRAASQASRESRYSLFCLAVIGQCEQFPGCIKEIVHFVRELRQKPELRLLRLVGNNKEGVDIWLGLREPLHIKSMLPEIEGVSISVRPLPHVGGNVEKLLGVRMTRVPAAEAVSEVS